ncbi:DUF1294 domain-containing protein [Psychrobacter sp.]|uniref:DUF1294 domain-containing protein n=1 Tax=Psychrobacter sp. TaxID=56811 RepID=UPI0025CF758E|nr:DUF1294 domain-containing protein [Psychrobacter sp.]
MKKNIIRRSANQVSFHQKQRQQLITGIGFYVVLIFTTIMGKLSLSVLGWYFLIGVVTFFVYAKDKQAAQLGKWRTPETTLHVLSALGGWVGAMFAQNYLRHKTQKPDFRLAYYVTVLINLAALLYLILGDDISKY